MSKITAALWDTEFSSEMPEGMDYATFHLLAEKKSALGSMKFTAALIHKLQSAPDSDTKQKWLEMEQRNLVQYQERAGL